MTLTPKLKKFPRDHLSGLVFFRIHFRKWCIEERKFEIETRLLNFETRSLNSKFLDWTSSLLSEFQHLGYTDEEFGFYFVIMPLSIHSWMHPGVIVLWLSFHTPPDVSTKEMRTRLSFILPLRNFSLQRCHPRCSIKL